MLRSDAASFEALHAYFLDRLVPVCAQLIDAAAEWRDPPDTDAYAGLRAVGNFWSASITTRTKSPAAWSDCLSPGYPAESGLS